jgi:YYY domain-containing protein
VLLGVLLWLVAVEVLGLATLPLANRLFSALPDRGYATSKMLGLLLVSYVAWVTGILGLTGFTGPTLIVVTLLLGAVAWWSWGERVRAAWTETRTLVLGAEVTFLVLFLLAVWIRAYNSAIAGQEKQMDMTFLNSLIRSSSLPAPDLWMAGYGMPYYYLGYLTQSVIAKATAIDPAIAYNLALCTVLALAGVGAFGLAAGLVRLTGASSRIAIGVGALGAFILMIMGNLEAFFELLAAQGFGDSAFWSALGIKNLTANVGSFPPADGGWWFRAARVIPNIQPDGITEFPYFSFLLGDLHPHYMAIPLAVLVATLAAQAVAVRVPLFATKLAEDRADANGNEAENRDRERGLGGDWVRIIVTAVVLGAVIPFNTWDVPVLWGVYGLSYLLPMLSGGQFTWPAVRDRARDLLVVVGIAIALYAPYLFVGYSSQPLSLGITQERTFFGTLFVLFGPLLLLALVAGLVGTAAARDQVDQRGEPAYGSRLLFIPATGLVIALLLLVMREPTLAFLVVSLAVWIPLLWVRARDGSAVAGVTAAVLTTIGLGSILVPELLYLSDTFGSRMNTVFKFYYDAWILLALAAPLLAWELARAVGALGAVQTPPWVRAVAASTLAVAGALVLAGALYPIAATNTKSGGFAGPATLDGLSYLRMARPDDVAAIEWLNHNHAGAVVVEAVGNDYSDAGRVSTFAATPTLIGWVGHQLQWRGPITELDRRQQLTRRIYTDPESVDWSDAFDRLGIEFVVVGSMEREIYGADVQTRIEGMMAPVFRSGSTVVYSARARAQGAAAA